ncbi:MAG: PAS domain S-box protein [Planctomycetes bacterium]|nr:PAS domain S-box protein [Planctomycetota bacterium]
MSKARHPGRARDVAPGGGGSAPGPKAAPAPARGSTAPLAALVDSCDDAIIAKDLDGRITSWNAAAERIYGYPAAEVLGRSLSFLVPPDRPDELPDIHRRILAGEPVEHFETVRLRKDGRPIDVSVTVSPVRDADGRVVGFSVIARDITAHKQVEARFRWLLDAAPDAMVIVDHQGRIVLVNAQTERLFGHPRADLLGRSVERLIPERFRARHSAHAIGFFAAPTVRPMGAGRELFALRRDGSEFPAEISLSPMESGGELLVTAAIRDISDRRAVEDQLKASLRDKEALLREVHHRVKNNLQIVCSLLHLQSNEAGVSEHARRTLQECEQRVLAMSTLHEMLYRSGDLGRVNFREYLRRLTAELLSTYGGGDVRVRVRSDGEAAGLGIDKAVPLGLLINELVANALKHAFPEGRPGEVVVSLKVSGPGALALTVRDDGVGMAAGVERRESSTLGMRIVESLCRQLKGSFEFRRDAGTEFRLVFPV